MPTNTIPPIIIFAFLAVGCCIVSFGIVFFFIRPFIVKRFEEETELYKEPYVQDRSIQKLIKMGVFSRVQIYTTLLFIVIVLPERMIYRRQSRKLLPKKYVLSLFSKKELILTFVTGLLVLIGALSMILATIVG